MARTISGEKKLRSGNSHQPDIRDLIRKAQSSQSSKESTGTSEDDDKKDKIDTYCTEADVGSTYSDTADLEKLADVFLAGSDTDEEQHEIPPPKRKSEFEKYLKSKQRVEQIRKYNEEINRETRNQRAEQRAKVRKRGEPLTDSESEEDSRETTESPTKKVRFKVE